MITRRDFLNGTAIALAAGATLSPRDLFALDTQAPGPTALTPDYYPPALTGMRGSHPGSFEVAHALAWKGEKPAQYTPLDETYDLIIVGGGISGLAAAYFYQQQSGSDRKILILENHDDFGGHAKRNEFSLNDQTVLGVGGSVNLETLSFSDTVSQTMDEIGVDLERLDAAREPDYLLSSLDAKSGYFLNESVYGKNQLIQGDWADAWRGGSQSHQLIGQLGLPPDQTKRLLALAAGEQDLLDDLSLMETKRYLESTSYEDFLSQKAGLSAETITLFDPYHKIYLGRSPDSCDAMLSMLIGYPGGNSVGLTGQIGNKVAAFGRDYVRFSIFPDGNASVARLMVRKLIPGIAPGDSMEDVINARFDYSQLDQEGSPVRIRLNSTAVEVKNEEDGVVVSYVQNGQPFKVRGKSSILACYNGIIPHICPELPEAQKENLKYGVKVPLVMTNVLVRNSSAITAAGPAQYHCPGSFYSVVTKAPPVNLGGYTPGPNEDDGPLVLWMCHAPSPKRSHQESARDLFRLGRHRLYQTPFATYEDEVNSQLNAMFGGNGFQADRDIAAITVNRWSHGYSYRYSSLFDPDWEAGQAPHELGRKPMGRIHIANSDSEGNASVQAAIDSAYRAVGELS